MSSAKCCSFHLGLNVLNDWFNEFRFVFDSEVLYMTTPKPNLQINDIKINEELA